MRKYAWHLLRLLVIVAITTSVFNIQRTEAQTRFAPELNAANDTPTNRANPFRQGSSMNQQPEANSDGVRVAQFDSGPIEVPGAIMEGELPGNSSVMETPYLESPVAEHSLGEMLPLNEPVSNSVTYGEQMSGVPVEGVPIENAPYESFPGGVSSIDGAPIEGQIFQDDFSGASESILYSSSNWFRRGHWYSTQEVVILQRGQIEDVLLSADQTLALIENRGTLNSVDAGFTYQPGARLTLGRFLGQDIVNRDYAMEMVFWGLYKYTGSAAIEADAPGRLQTGLGANSDYNVNTNGFGQRFAAINGLGNSPEVQGFRQADRQTLDYDADFNSWEMNLRIQSRPLRDRLALQPSGRWIRHATPSRMRSGLMGLRYISMNEFMRFQSFFLNPTSQGGDYQLQVHNDMFGVQVGGDISENYGDFTWGARTRVAGMLNFADRQNQVGVTEPFFQSSRSENVSKENLAIMVEAGLYTSYQIRANLLARIGYDFSYLTGIAAASPNLSLAPAFPRLDVNDDAFFHGLSMGVQMLW